MGSKGKLPKNQQSTGTYFSHVQQVAQLLDKAYRKSTLGNKKNPLDELAYIILSGQTNESRYQEVFRAFRKRFPRWEQVVNADVNEIAEAINIGGLAKQKARYLQEIACRLKRDFGRVSLRPLKDMSVDDAERYLCSLLGVGIKTARCVLMYSLRKEVFPADIHCLRVMTRLGWINWQGQRADTFADTAQAGIPPALRELLHIRFVQHGRAICKPAPLCKQCVLNHLCPSACLSREAVKAIGRK